MKWRNDPEHLRIEQKFRATGDIRFAALAVGRWQAYGRRSEDAPRWALEACARLYERATAEIAPVIAKTQGSGPGALDYAHVEWVAGQQAAGSKKTVRQLIRDRLRLTGCKNEETDLHRLLNYFNGRNGGPTAEHHVDQAAKRMARARGIREVGEM